MPESAAVETLAVRRRRQSRREEWTIHTKLAALLDRYCDPSWWWWTSMENKPLSSLSGLLQKRRGVRRGLPDVMVLLRRDAGTIVIFIELKSRRGRVTPAQKQVRADMLPTGAVWVMARSARAAMTALHFSGVPFRCKWEPPQLEPWEEPLFDPTRRLPQHPEVAAERREAKRRYRLRKKIREREAALAAMRSEAGLPDAHDAQPVNDLPVSVQRRRTNGGPLRARLPSRESVMAAADRAEARSRLKSTSDRH